MNRKLLTEHGQKTIAFSERPGVDFCLSAKEVGRGASCVVYHAVSSDQTEHLLKEYYPKHLDLSRDSSGQIIVPADQADAFDDGLQRFRAGCEQQKTIRLSNEGLKNFTCNVQGYYHGNGTQYIDMTCFNGQTYDHVQEESAHNLMRRMRTLTYVVGNYHKSGLLHLDIKPENIYVRPKGETVEDVMLFDFDSVTPISELRTPKALSCTKTWAAPEQLLPNRRDRICEATDIFAIGEILFYKLMGRHSESRERRSFSTFTFDDSNPLFKNVNPQLFPLLEEILKHTICNVVENRYQDTDALLEKLEQAIVLSNPHEPFLHHHLPSKAAFFIGRDVVLEEIEDRLKQTDKLFISSIGGMGKSELAKQYAHAHKDDYDAVIFCVWSTDLESMILDDLPVGNLQQNDEKAKEYAARKYRVLSELCSKQRVLIIVDNFNDLQDKALAKLLRLNCKILFTTRHDVTEYNYEQLRLGTLDEEYVWALFRKWYKRELTAEDHAAVQQIFDLYQNHTMAVELIAKQMQASNVTPKEMLGRLNAGGFSDSGRERVIHAKDGTNTKMNIHDHIRRLFDVSDLSEEQVYILANLALIPPTGISRKQFHDWCNLDTYEDITDLKESGWLQQNEEKDLISLHPVVADVMLDDLEQQPWLCDEMLLSAIEYTRAYLPCADADSRKQLSKIVTQICSILVSFEDFPPNGVVLINLCASCFAEHEGSKKWIHYLEKAFQLYRPHGHGVDEYSLTIYNNLAVLYHEAGQLKKAEKYYNRVLKEAARMKEYLQRDYQIVGTVYNNLATLYMDQEKYRYAKETLIKAVRFHESLQESSILNVVTACSNLGRTYMNLEQYSEAISVLMKAHSLLISCGYDKSENMALVLCNLSEVYERQEDYAEALKYKMEELHIWRASFGEEYVDTANAYYDAGNLYRCVGKHSESINCFAAALKAYENKGKSTQWETARTYSALGKTYAELREYDSAEACYKRSLSIRTTFFPDEQELIQLVLDRLEELQKAQQRS